MQILGIRKYKKNNKNERARLRMSKNCSTFALN